MRKLPFKASPVISLGIELEYQLIDPMTYDLISRAKDLIKNIQVSVYKKRIKPEITQSMIEINSSVHTTPDTLYEELHEIRHFLREQGDNIGVLFAGGGTHPFQKWPLRKIFPTKRFKKLSKQYKYLSKRATVFGQHIHVGCQSAEDALYLTHAFIRYVPQFIAISAASPFFEGVDTGFQCARLNVFTAFPSSGAMPLLTNWQEFSNYFYKMRSLGILETMKDVYWDVRPKPEFGTVEVRVCDTPLTLEAAILISAYLQILGTYLLQEKPFEINQDLYYLYGYNRFQSCRYGLKGRVINPNTFQECTIQQDILATIDVIQNYACHYNSWDFLQRLKEKISGWHNDAKLLRETFKQTGFLTRVVHQQCALWSEG